MQSAGSQITHITNRFKSDSARFTYIYTQILGSALSPHILLGARNTPIKSEQCTTWNYGLSLLSNENRNNQFHWCVHRSRHTLLHGSNRWSWPHKNMLQKLLYVDVKYCCFFIPLLKSLNTLVRSSRRRPISDVKWTIYQIYYIARFRHLKALVNHNHNHEFFVTHITALFDETTSVWRHNGWAYALQLESGTWGGLRVVRSSGWINWRLPQPKGYAKLFGFFRLKYVHVKKG